MEVKDTGLTNKSRDFLIPLNSSHHTTALSTRYKERVAHVASESPSFTSSGYILSVEDTVDHSVNRRSVVFGAGLLT